MKQALKWSVLDLIVEKRNVIFYVWFRSDLPLFSFKIKCTWNQIPILIPFRAQSEHLNSSWRKYGMFPVNVHWTWEANNCSIITKLTYPKEKLKIIGIITTLGSLEWNLTVRNTYNQQNVFLLRSSSFCDTSEIKGMNNVMKKNLRINERSSLWPYVHQSY